MANFNKQGTLVGGGGRMSIKLNSTKAVDVSAAEKFLGAIEEDEVEERGLIELWKNR